MGRIVHDYPNLSHILWNIQFMFETTNLSQPVFRYVSTVSGVPPERSRWCSPGNAWGNGDETTGTVPRKVRSHDLPQPAQRGAPRDAIKDALGRLSTK